MTWADFYLICFLVGFGLSAEICQSPELLVRSSTSTFASEPSPSLRQMTARAAAAGREAAALGGQPPFAQPADPPVAPTAAPTPPNGWHR